MFWSHATRMKSLFFSLWNDFFAFFLVCCGCDTSYIVTVHIQGQASIYTLSLCRGHSCRVRLAKQETLTPPGHLVSPPVCRGPWMSTVVLYCWCHSESASALLYFIFFCICHTCSLCRMELVVQFPARGSTQLLLCLFPGVLWLWHFLYGNCPHPGSSLHIYTFVVSRAFMAGVASQAGDADSSRAPGLTSGLQGSVNCPPWCSIVGATVTVHQLFYFLLVCYFGKVLPLFQKWV